LSSAIARVSRQHQERTATLLAITMEIERFKTFYSILQSKDIERLHNFYCQTPILLLSSLINDCETLRDYERNIEFEEVEESGDCDLISYMNQAVNQRIRVCLHDTY
jgi:hypothetical protein